MLRRYLWAMIGLGGLVLFLSGCSAPPPVEPESLKADRPSYHDYRLALPLSPLEEITDRLKTELRFRPVNLEFILKANGQAKKVRLIDSIRPRGWDEISSVLKDIRFYPGRRGERTVEQTIPAILYLAFDKGYRRLILPVDSLGRIEDGDLYRRALAMNKLELARVSRFPSYFLDIAPHDSLGAVDYFLARITLDSTQRLQSYEVLHSDAGPYGSQIASAINWADVRLPSEAGEKDATGYLRIAFYDLVPYPTRPYEADRGSLKLPERERVRLFTDTVGLMFKPIPRQYPEGGLYSTMGGEVRYSDSLYARIRINADGRVLSFKPFGGGNNDRLMFHELMAWLKFYPALNFRGEPQPFEGIIRLEYHSSTRVRIRFLWVPGEGGAY